MEATQEDKREAVNMGVSLSSQLIAAAFALMGVIGGFISYIIENGNSHWNYLLFAGGIIFYICSIYQGAIGITVARNNGFNGNWTLKVSKKYFNRQAIYMGVGTLCLLVTIFFIKKQDDEAVKELRMINEILEKRFPTIDSINKTYDVRITTMEHELDSLYIILSKNTK